MINLPMPIWFGTLPCRITWRGLPGALALGLAFGLVASQCTTPVLAAILTTVVDTSPQASHNGKRAISLPRRPVTQACDKRGVLGAREAALQGSQHGGQVAPPECSRIKPEPGKDRAAQQALAIGR